MWARKFVGLALIVLAVSIHLFASHTKGEMGITASPENNLYGSADAPYRPGATNPVKNPGRLYLMRDDILCTLFGKVNDNTLTRNWNRPANTDLTSWVNDSSASLSEPDYGNGLNKNVISPTALAMGRINGPQKDDVVGAFYYIDGKTVKPYVFFVDNPQLNTKATDPFRPIYFAPDTAHDDYYSIDIAVGDLDRKLNAQGEYNDEIVVLFRSRWADDADRVATVAVLDKDLKLIDFNYGNSILDYPTGNNEYTRPYFSVTLGDYDEDGACEIAIGFRTADSHGGNQKYEISTYQLNSEGTIPRYDSYVYGIDTTGNFQYNAVDLTSGDFNGDGTDEIAVSVSSFQNVDPYDQLNLVPYLSIFTTDRDLNLEKRGTWHPLDVNFWIGSVRGAGVTSGLFKFNPSAGYTTARKQIAMACIPRDFRDGVSYYSNAITFEVNDQFTPSMVDYYVGGGDAVYYPIDNTSIPKITAGNFKGIDTKTVTEQIAVSWAESERDKWGKEGPPKPKFAVYDVDENLKLGLKYHGDFKPGQPETSDQEFMSVPIVAADRDGNGYYLGAPIHLVVPQSVRANYVIQEPPKHLDYLPVDDSGNWEVVRVSRTRGFYATFTYDKTKTLETEHTDTTNFDIGGSEKVSAKETVGEDVGIADATVTLKESEKLAYDYDSVTKDLNGHYQAVTTKAEYDSNRDDYIQALFKVMDIWRFPIYGLKTQNRLNAFYEVVMPGPTTETLNTWGLSLPDYYQPLHENGNILSYPQISDEKFPEDLGSFKVKGVDISEAMSAETVVTWGEGSGSTEIQWGKDSWSEATKTHTHKLNFNADFQVGFHGEVNEITTKEKWYANIDLSFHTGKSWSKTDFTKNTISTTNLISLYLPSTGKIDQAYNLKPVVYSTKDGTLKLGHAVDPTAPNALWWQRHYHGQSDLALNLPMKFNWVASKHQDPNYLGTWYVGADRQSRSRMRRLFLLHNEPKTKDTEKLFVASSPTAGDIIYVLTTVYNYSLDTASGDFKVRFSYAEYNPDLENTEPTLTTIGEIQTGSLGPLGHRDVYIKWDTTGLGGNKPDTAKAYVIYITVDPDNEVKDEIHELHVGDQSPTPSKTCPIGKDSNGNIVYSKECGIFCGSNNQGYWPWDNSFKIFSAKTHEESQEGAGKDISIETGSLEVETTPESEASEPYIWTDVPYRVKVNIVSDGADRNYREVYFYDNDKVFSVRRAFGLNPGNNDFHCPWTPETPGQHTLKVMVVEDEDDKEPGNNTATLDVFVEEFGMTWHR